MTPYFIAQVNYGHGWYDLTIAKHYPTVEAAKVRRYIISISPEAAKKWEGVKPGERSAMVERMLMEEK